ncbi:adenylate kinase [Strigomonas culicis]|uniref:Adenylate kinase n=1 Tax=Strigomonas culicis TaxID=28005 RepID=S9UDP8_9TRYP|nr:adenylate kinase [Strigomonas culicis]EPY35712.1 adenylate kinase [Strigomonas culicis]|eukprot:EPY28942.1 adenylate kinase [Strigomonas culicis]
MKVIIEGPLQGGKTTVSSVVKERYGLCYVSSAEAVRNAIQVGSFPYSNTLKQLMEKGEAIPDTLLVKAVSDATRRPDCANGFVLDGFPRTKRQALLLQEFEKVQADVVVEMDLADHVMQARFGGRQFHPGSGRLYHTIYNPPIHPGKDDATGEPLQQKEEDTPDAIAQRMLQYRRLIAEVRGTFRADQWVPVDASGNIEAVRNNVFAVLDALQMSVLNAKVSTAKKAWWKLW